MFTSNRSAIRHGRPASGYCGTPSYKTLVAASSAEGEGKKTGGNVAAAKVVGKTIAERAKAKGISKVVFDRGGYIYHGRVKALADAAREGGLHF